MQRVAQRVLLADDDGPLARVVAANLRMRGFFVDVVSTGAAVVERLAGIDVVLLDMRLPDLTGLEVLAQVRRVPDPPAVVLISGFLDVKTTLDAMRLGAAEVLEKPVEPAHLAQVLLTARGSRARGAPGTADLVGGSPVMQRLREQIAQVAAFGELPVLIVGESGTGKELVARAIHQLGRSHTPMVAINCAAMPEPLVESELFGHAAGAFTGARGAREGLLETARDGTLFLDEIGEMPLGLQAKLLRVLDTHSFRRVGANQDQPFHGRVVSATNRPLRGAEGEALRPDLYFRLAGYTIVTPPLRRRKEDLEELSTHFLASFGERHPGAATRLSPEALEALRSYDWPGNVRELRAVLHSAVVRTTADVVGVRHVVQALHPCGHWSSTPPPPVTDEHTTQIRAIVTTQPVPDVGLPELERNVILDVVGRCDGNLSQAARQLKIPRSTLRDKMRRYRSR